MIKLKNKKAIERSYLIAIIVLVVSFAIILLFLSRLNPQQEVLQKACYASVVLRGLAASETLKTEFRTAIVLKCNVTRICLTSGDDCKSLGNNYEKIKVKTREDVLDAIAQNMYDWHMTLNEGNSNFMPQGFSENKFCILNSIISLDENTKTMIQQNPINRLDLYRVLQNKKDSKGQSYLKDLVKIDDVSQLSSLEQLKAETPGIEKTIFDTPLDFSKDHALVTSLAESSKWESILKGSGAGVLGAVVTGVILAPISGGLSLTITLAALGVGTGSGVATFYYSKPSPNSDYQYAAPTITSLDHLGALKCTGFEGLI